MLFLVEPQLTDVLLGALRDLATAAVTAAAAASTAVVIGTIAVIGTRRALRRTRSPGRPLPAPA
jgi:hypothetical protein